MFDDEGCSEYVCARIVVVGTLSPISSSLKKKLRLSERRIISIVADLDSRWESAFEKDSNVRESTVLLIIEGEGSKNRLYNDFFSLTRQSRNSYIINQIQ